MKKSLMNQMLRIMSLFAVGGLAGATEILTGPVGINGSPVCTLQVNANVGNSEVRLTNGGSTTNYYMMKDYGNAVAQIEKVVANGGVQIEYSPRPMDGVSAAYFKFFRFTNTTGEKSLTLCRGDGSNNADIRLGVGGTNSFFMNTRIGINTINPSSAYFLDVAGASRLQSASITNALTAGTVAAAGTVSGASVTATGAVAGATVASTGAMTSGGNLTVNGEITCNVINILGGADLSEGFNVKPGAAGVLPGMLVCIDPADAGNLIVSSRAYDRTVAGIVSGANGVTPGMVMQQSNVKVASGSHPVALSGRVYCLADATNGPIVPGDLLTTSDTPGHAMKAAQGDRAPGAVIGKAMTSLETGRGLVLTLVSLQ